MIVPVVAAFTSPATAYVATAPFARSTVVAIVFPVPEGSSQLPVPVVIVHVQLTFASATGIVSETVAFAIA